VTVCLGGWDMFGIRERYRALTHPSVSPVAVPLWAHPRDGTVPLSFFLRDQDKNQLMIVQEYAQA